MANKKNQYSSEFKSEVALKALARDKKNLEPLSKRYKVPVSLILVWATQLEENPAGIDEGSEELPVEQDEPAPIDLEIKGNETINSFKQGVMGDNLNYKRLIAWTVIGLILVTIFVQMLIEIFGIGNGRRPQQIGGEHAFYQVTRKKQKAQKEISTFGVMDEKSDIYRVPIDMVIEQMAQEAAPDTTSEELLEKIEPATVEE